MNFNLKKFSDALHGLCVVETNVYKSNIHRSTKRCLYLCNIVSH